MDAMAQIPPGVDVETLRVVGGSPEPGLMLEAGEAIAVWVDGDVSLVVPRRVELPVADAGPGEVIARFAGGSPFAWSPNPVVWTAPHAGRLEFTLNAAPDQAIDGEADVTVVRLTSSDVRAAFEPPVLTLERVEGGVRARYDDRAGFGLDTRTLRFTVTASDGSVVSIAPWAPVGARSTKLPLPPSGITLPAGVHRLSATITDRVGNDAVPAVVLFDSARSEGKE